MNFLTKDKVVDCLTCWFGAGALPGPRGTWGSLAALPFAYVIMLLGGAEALFVSSIIVFFIGIIVCDLYVKRTKTKDPSFAVIDEVAGQWLGLVTVAHMSLFYFIIGFFLFRFFDITKLQPAKRLEALDGGLGIMADDMIAGIYTAICIYFMQIYIPQIYQIEQNLINILF
ncbi:MAG: phosphatidylglycerophosphatase A [Pseudomonadota bacterium]